MKTVDSFLQDIIKNNFYQPDILWENKDKKILESLSHQLKNGVFLTENQGNLLLKILTDYRDKLEKSTTSSLLFLESPLWSKEFRLLDIVKTIFLKKSDFSEIFIEFSYNKKIKEKLFSLTKSVYGSIVHHKNNLYSVPLTENNICLLVDTFKEYGFKFDEKLINFYKEIEEIKSKSAVTFDITKTTNVRLLEQLQEEIGSNNISSTIFLHDRKLKFQYAYTQVLEENSLKGLIAKRSDVDVYINSNSYSFKDVLSAIIDLQRFPLLIIFDYYRPDFCKKLLDQIRQTFVDLDIKEKVGIYFRLDNNLNQDFNTRIADLGYNTYLDSDTQLVGLSNKQLPKFLVKEGWKPKAVLCFSPSFKNTKINSYCDSVDLKICYSENKPVSGFDYAIM